MRKPKVVDLPLSEIRPYWRNPRDNHAAVAAVVESIRQFGYNQYITVDHERVIVTGHTRYLALRELGWERVPVLELDLTAQQAKAYRIADNKSAEFATWKGPELTLELRELDVPALMTPFFPGQDISRLIADSLAPVARVGNADVARAAAGMGSIAAQSLALFQQGQREVACPHCGATFTIQGK